MLTLALAAANIAARHRYQYPRANAAPTPTAHGAHSTSYGSTAVAKPCGHRAHVGTCGACQRAALAKAQRQLAQAQAARIAWAQRTAAS